MNFDNIDGIPLSSPALIYFPRLLQDAGAALVIKLSPKFGEKKLGGGEPNLNGGANLIVCLTVRLLIKTSYRLVVSGFFYQFFFLLEISVWV